MKKLSYKQVIHNLMWITFFEKNFKKSLDNLTFMYYNTTMLKITNT